MTAILFAFLLALVAAVVTELVERYLMASGFGALCITLTASMIVAVLTDWRYAPPMDTTQRVGHAHR